ncbi:MAG: TRAP transporter small permease subunit [Pseudomonadota bacterium]
MSGASKPVVGWREWPSLILFLCLGAVVLLQFLSRYVLNDSVAWTEEVARYLLIGVAYAGSVNVLHKGEHIFLEWAYRKISRVDIKPLALFTDVIVLAFHVWIAVLSVQLTFAADRRMTSVDLPKNVVYGFVALTLLAAVLVALLRLRRRYRQSSDEILRGIEQSASAEESV